MIRRNRVEGEVFPRRFSVRPLRFHVSPGDMELVSAASGFYGEDYTAAPAPSNEVIRAALSGVYGDLLLQETPYPSSD